jgi:hypothetical protein
VPFGVVSEEVSQAEDLQARVPVAMAGVQVEAAPPRDSEVAPAHEGVLRFAGRADADATSKSWSPLSSRPTRRRTPRFPTARS